ncbi:MAG: hypothetical protein L0241_21485, partial [Planctomycetia bacterium]|nr:hypothetical protein [Planctomycetia bacterium]
AFVIVEREEANGWLAITAPKGSVSWIAAAFVEDVAPDRPTPKIGYVHTEGEVTLACGKAGLMQPLDIRREKVPQGTGVLIIGPKVEFGGKKWYPIEPPAGDVRYLPKTAVQFDKPANNAFTVRVNDKTGELPPPAVSPTVPVSPPISIPGSGTATPTAGGTTSSKPAVNHPLWAQAEAAERDGRPDDAEKHYFELARLMNSPGGDHDIANLCYTRIHTLREKKRNGGAGASPSGGVLRPPAKDDRGVRPGTPTAIPPVAGPNAPENRPQWSGVGTMRRSAITLDGRAAYALESSPGVVKFYVVGTQGVNLEKYLGKRVDVYGIAYTRNGLSKPYITATSVEPAP